MGDKNKEPGKLEGKTVLLGICACTPAYKAIDITAGLRRMGADVKIVVTENAVNMVPVQVLERMSGNPVQIEQFGRPVTWDPNYKSWGRGGDLLVIAPCTANMMGKLANGIADDYLSTNTLSFDGPKMIAMNMNPKLYANPAVQRNIKQLKEDGYSFVAPESEDKPSKFPGVDAVIFAVCSALE